MINKKNIVSTIIMFIVASLLFVNCGDYGELSPGNVEQKATYPNPIWSITPAHFGSAASYAEAYDTLMTDAGLTWPTSNDITGDQDGAGFRASLNWKNTARDRFYSKEYGGYTAITKEDGSAYTGMKDYVEYNFSKFMRLTGLIWLPDEQNFAVPICYGQSRTMETIVMNLICDAFKWWGEEKISDTYDPYDGSNTPIISVVGGYNNANGVQWFKLEEEITEYDWLNIFNYANTLRVIKMPIGALREAIEFGLNSLPSASTKFCNISGGKIKIDPSRSKTQSSDYAATGDRLVELYITDINGNDTLVYQDTVANGLSDGIWLNGFNASDSVVVIENSYFAGGAYSNRLKPNDNEGNWGINSLVYDGSSDSVDYQVTAQYMNTMVNTNGVDVFKLEGRIQVSEDLTQTYPDVQWKY